MSEPTQTKAEPIGESFKDFFASDYQSDASETEVEVSVVDAARLLGITERSVWRRISAKKLKSRNHGGKTTVSLRQSDIKPTTTEESTDVNANRTDTTVVPDVRQTNASVTESAMELIREMQSKLESAAYRNGYLESLLNEKNEQLKLLPDFQMKIEESKLVEEKLEQEAEEKRQLQKMLDESLAEKQVLEKRLEKYKQSWWLRFGAWFTGQNKILGEE